MYSSTLSLTSALDGGGWSTPRPGRFTPGNDPVPSVQEAGVVWTGVLGGLYNLQVPCYVLQQSVRLIILFLHSNFLQKFTLKI